MPFTIIAGRRGVYRQVQRAFDRQVEDKRNSEGAEICEQARLVQAVFQRRENSHSKPAYICCPCEIRIYSERDYWSCRNTLYYGQQSCEGFWWKVIIQDLTRFVLLFRFTGIDITKCPVCKEGKMRTTQTLLPARCNGPWYWNRMSNTRDRNNNATPSLTENRLVFRNDILLPKSPVSCIVVTNRGLRNGPESPLFTEINPATVSKPLPERTVQF